MCPAGSPAPSLGREAPKLLNDRSRVWGDQRGERPRVELAAGRGGAVCEVAGKFWPRELGGGRVLLSLLLGVHPTLAQPLHCAKE